MKKRINAKTMRLRLLGLSVASAMLAPQLAPAQDGVEWDPQKGYHEEEWYDPSDWFDDDSTVDYEHDGYDYYDGYWDGLLWYDDYDYDANEDADTDFVWNEETEEWELSRGEEATEFSAKYEFEDTPVAQSTQSTQSSQSMQSDKPKQSGQPSASSQSTQSAQSGQSTQSSASMQSDKPKQSGESSQSAQSAQSSRSSQSARSTQSSESMQSNAPKQSSPSQASVGQSASQQSVDTLTGEIEAFRKIEVTYPAGFEETHALAKVSLENGETAVVDLGMASFFNAELKAGDEVTLHGSRGTIDGRNVFVATELTSKGETAYIDRTIATQGRSGEIQSQKSGSSLSSGQGNDVVLEGKIAEQESVQLAGEKEAQSFVKLELQNGRSATVKLGPETSVQELNLQKGDQIRIRGQRDQIEGKNVVVARSIRVEGEKIKG